jgi:hypothetical protein
MPTFRKGLEAIEEATNSGGKKFSPFVPQIKWSEDKESKYILMLTPISESVTCDLHEWIKVGENSRRDGTKYDNFEQFISRKDDGIREDYDDIEDRLGKLPRRRTLGVAVELDPILEVKDGRKRPKGFAVKTETYTNRDGDEVETPVIGIVLQASKNFYGWLGSFDNNQAPITETPFQVVRRGMDSDTTYDFMPFVDQEVDFTPLFDGLDTVNYLSDEYEELNNQLSNYENDNEAASAIGIALLDKRIAELADGERYKSLIDPIKELPRSKYDRKPESKERSRPERPSPRSRGSHSPSNSGDEEPSRFERLKNLRESLDN